MNSQRTKVLALDSDPEFLVALEHVLEAAGLDTTTTWDAAEAISLLASEPFAVLLVGEHPPEVCCTEVLKRLQDIKRCPVLIVLETDSRQLEAQYLCAVGAYAVIPKWKYERIVETVREISGIAAGEEISASP